MKLNKFAQIKWERAKNLKKTGQYHEAEEELRNALQDAPDHPLLKASLAELYLRQDRLTEARMLSESILSLDPQYPQAKYLMGEISFKEDRLEEALQYFYQATQKNPSYYAFQRLARTLRKMKRYEEALDTVNSALVKYKNNLPLLKEKALVLSRMRHWDEALRIYQKAKELDPKDKFVVKEIYKLRGMDRDDEKVIKELQMVLSLPSEKDNQQLHGLLGQKLKEAAKWKEAAVEFHTAWLLSSGDVFFLKQEGYCHYHLGNYEKATKYLGEAFKKKPNDYILKATLKKLYTTTGNLKLFAGLIEETLKDHPHNVKLMGALKGIKKQIHAEKT